MPRRQCPAADCLGRDLQHQATRRAKLEGPRHLEGTGELELTALDGVADVLGIHGRLELLAAPGRPHVLAGPAAEGLERGGSVVRRRLGPLPSGLLEVLRHSASLLSTRPSSSGIGRAVSTRHADG